MTDRGQYIFYLLNSYLKSENNMCLFVDQIMLDCFHSRVAGSVKSMTSLLRGFVNYHSFILYEYPVGDASLRRLTMMGEIEISAVTWFRATYDRVILIEAACGLVGK